MSGGFVVEMNSVESFSFLFKNLWLPNINAKLKLNILDTILLHKGEPYLWLFTSEKTGVSIIDISAFIITHSSFHFFARK
jgi:hypothetical protein